MNANKVTFDLALVRFSFLRVPGMNPAPSGYLLGAFDYGSRRATTSRVASYNDPTSSKTREVDSFAASMAASAPRSNVPWATSGSLPTTGTRSRSSGPSSNPVRTVAAVASNAHLSPRYGIASSPMAPLQSRTPSYAQGTASSSARTEARSNRAGTVSRAAVPTAPPTQSAPTSLLSSAPTSSSLVSMTRSSTTARNDVDNLSYLDRQQQKATALRQQLHAPTSARSPGINLSASSLSMRVLDPAARSAGSPPQLSGGSPRSHPASSSHYALLATSEHLTPADEAARLAHSQSGATVSSRLPLLSRTNSGFSTSYSGRSIVVGVSNALETPPASPIEAATAALIARPERPRLSTESYAYSGGLPGGSSSSLISPGRSSPPRPMGIAPAGHAAAAGSLSRSASMQHSPGVTADGRAANTERSTAPAPGGPYEPLPVSARSRASSNASGGRASSEQSHTARQRAGSTASVHSRAAALRQQPAPQSPSGGGVELASSSQLLPAGGPGALSPRSAAGAHPSSAPSVAPLALHRVASLSLQPPGPPGAPPHAPPGAAGVLSRSYHSSAHAAAASSITDVSLPDEPSAPQHSGRSRKDSEAAVTNAPTSARSSASAANGPASARSSVGSASALDGLLARTRPPPPPRPPGGGLVGLSNLGNTCFMNATLQCLSNIPQLRDYFLGPHWRGDVNGTSPTKGELAVAFGSLMRDMWLRETGPGGVVTPYAFKSAVSQLAGRLFAGYSQHDSHEFLRFLVEALCDDTSRVTGKKPYRELEAPPAKGDEVLSADWWRYYLSRVLSEVWAIFSGQLKTSVTCSRCGTVHRAFDPVQDLQLPIPSGGGGGMLGSLFSGSSAVPLTRCLQEFSSEERLSGDNAYYCGVCKAHTECTKSMQLFRPPPVLVLQLKRFSSSGWRRSKVDTPVAVPVTGLDVAPFCAANGELNGRLRTAPFRI